jgi:hypothetical protein
MAISLNEGSYGLLMDPSNGVADIEARLLRLVSNYGFLDNPALLIRATRLKARLGFELEERTQTRYENAKGDEVIEYLSDTGTSRELEQIGHEEEPLKSAGGPRSRGLDAASLCPLDRSQGGCRKADRAARSGQRAPGAGRPSRCFRRSDAVADRQD